jgi:hypothetical protein
MLAIKKKIPLFNWFHKPKHVELTKFDHVMDFAQTLAQHNPAALVDLVRILLRPLQSELLLTAIENEMHGARKEVETYKFFMPNHSSSIQNCWNYPKLPAKNFSIQLNRDPVLPCPWKRTDYIETLSTIGESKYCGEWKEDTINHKITVWLPWGIAFVNGGNHSIAAGIIGGEGVLEPKEVYDMGGLLDIVQCDGKQYSSKKNGQVLDLVHDYKNAALFEVGRLMRDHRIIPMLRSLKAQP